MEIPVKCEKDPEPLRHRPGQRGDEILFVTDTDAAKAARSKPQREGYSASFGQLRRWSRYSVSPFRFDGGDLCDGESV